MDNRDKKKLCINNIVWNTKHDDVSSYHPVCSKRGYGVYRQFQKYISCIVDVSFIGELGENHRPAASLTNFITYYCIEYTSPCAECKLTILVLISTDCIGSGKFNYHTITTRMDLLFNTTMHYA